jgi:hypothetical protein
MGCDPVARIVAALGEKSVSWSGNGVTACGRVGGPSGRSRRSRHSGELRSAEFAGFPLGPLSLLSLLRPLTIALPELAEQRIPVFLE